MNLRQKLFSIFDCYYSEGTSNKAIFADLSRRGKFDLVKLTALTLALYEELEALPETKTKK